MRTAGFGLESLLGSESGELEGQVVGEGKRKTRNNRAGAKGQNRDTVYCDMARVVLIVLRGYLRRVTRRLIS